VEEVEQRGGTFRRLVLDVQQSGVLERDGRVRGERFQQPHVLLVELMDAELREHDDAHQTVAMDHGHGDHRLLDVVRAGYRDGEGVGVRVRCVVRGPALRDVPGDPLPDMRDQLVERLVLVLPQGPPEGDGQQRDAIGVHQEDPAVVVVDEGPELVRDGFADLTDVVQAAELRRERLERAQVRHRADLAAGRHGGHSGIGAKTRAFPVRVRLARAVAVPGGGLQPGEEVVPRQAGGLMDAEPDPVLARRFRLQEGQVGAGHQLARAGRVQRALGHADAHRDLTDHRGGHRGDPLAAPLGQRGGLGQRGARKDDGELLAADPADQVLQAGHLASDGGHALQDLIADQMPVRVVDPLEVVDVEQDQADGRALAVRPPELPLEPFVEVTVVVERREVIGDDFGLEPRADLRVVDGEGRELGQDNGELELPDVEPLALPPPGRARGCPSGRLVRAAGSPPATPARRSCSGYGRREVRGRRRWRAGERETQP
jgi:hypothetical protein